MIIDEVIEFLKEKYKRENYTPVSIKCDNDSWKYLAVDYMFEVVRDHIQQQKIDWKEIKDGN